MSEISAQSLNDYLEALGLPRLPANGGESDQSLATTMRPRRMDRILGRSFNTIRDGLRALDPEEVERLLLSSNKGSRQLLLRSLLES